jgi:hypothetical protein
VKSEPIETAASSICAAPYSEEALPQIWPMRLSHPSMPVSMYQAGWREGDEPSIHAIMGTYSAGQRYLSVKYMAPVT